MAVKPQKLTGYTLLRRELMSRSTSGVCACCEVAGELGSRPLDRVCVGSKTYGRLDVKVVAPVHRGEDLRIKVQALFVVARSLQ